MCSRCRALATSSGCGPIGSQRRRRQGPLATAPGRGRLLGSFAFRLGIGFALVALAGATVTAVVVNTAFAARFDRYLNQQQAAQLDSIGAAIGRAYAGQGRWDPDALATLVPAVGSGTVRVVGSSGQPVWHWDGHQMGWDDRWMEPGDHGDQRPEETRGAGQPAPPGQDAEDSHRSGASWNDQAPARGEIAVASLPAGGLPTAGASTTTLASTADPVRLGPVQRIPIQVDGTVVGTALVQLPEVTALPAAVAFRSQVVRLLLAGGGLGALGSLALGIMVARRATRPVREVTGAARALAAGDRAVRLDPHRSDEFGEMGRAFNAMADAVDGQERLRRSFAAEVAHELRTPLTILRSQVEGLRVGVLQPTDQALGSLEEEVRRMARLVADLQVLSAADAAGFSLDRAPTDLRALVEQAVGEFAGLFEGNQVRLEIRLAPVSAWVDRIRMGQVLANLLANALKFTPTGGLVSVELQRDRDRALLRVSDSGPGIPAEELPHIFDRFYRGHTARASGTGIGLTVVRELIGAHGGTVQAASQPGQGASFTIHLPLQATSPDNRFHTASTQPASSVGA
jgi:two-component system sensor histidine kinase BaeS